jgi:chromosome segregation ATPase
MNEIVLTAIIFLSLTSSAWLTWFFLYREKPTKIFPKKKVEQINPLEIYINDMEKRYDAKRSKANAFEQENRELKGKLFQEKNRVVTLSDRLQDLQGRNFVFNSKTAIEELESELKEKEETIKKLMSQLALHPMEEDKDK